MGAVQLLVGARVELFVQVVVVALVVLQCGVGFVHGCFVA